MADQTPGGTNHDPLADRLRSTFQAEHAEVERRHLAKGDTQARTRNFRWVPFAAAAALIAVAGFFFIGNRAEDRAVELDIAQQPSQVTPDAAGTTVAGDAEEPPLPTVVALNAAPEGLPYLTGVSFCNDFDLDRTIVWGPDMLVPSLRIPENSGTAGVVRQLARGEVVEPIGGCTAGETSLGRQEWYEIAGQGDGPTEWIRSDYLITVQEFARLVESDPVQPDRSARLNGCGEESFVFPFRFIWGIQPDDPDGGLVAHTTVGVDAPVTRIITLDEVVVVTGQCELSSTGSPWLELRAADGSQDWVSGRYVREAVGGCLDPGTPEEVPGLAIADGNQAAFAEPNAMRYQWYPIGRVLIGQCPVAVGDEVPCPVFGPLFVWDVAENDPDGGLLTHTAPDVDAPVVRVLPHDQADITATGRCAQSSTGSMWWELGYLDRTDWASGNFLAHPIASCLSSGSSDAVPIDGWAAVDGDRVAFAARGQARYRWYDADDVLLDQPCVATSESSSLGACSLTANAGGATGVISGGNANSTADHVHDMRVDRDGECTRIIIEFGEAANEDDRPAARLPLVEVTYDLDSITVAPQAPGWESSFGDNQRIDYPGGVGLLRVSLGFRFTAELMHRDLQPYIRFLENPARIVIDLFPTTSPAATTVGPFGERFVLRGPIQRDLFGPGIAVGNDIVVEGFGRPFEAQGEYRIWSVPDNVDPDAFLNDPPTPLVRNTFITSSWADGWGDFFIDLPELEPGSYIAVFGELPPTDEIGFYGTGQLFRVADPTDPGNTRYPRAVLLPNVELPPES